MCPQPPSQHPSRCPRGTLSWPWALRTFPEAGKSCLPIPTSPPLPVSFCRTGYAKGKINSRWRQGRHQVWILGNETSMWRKVTQSFYTLCALLSFVQCWAWRERAKEPWGGRGFKEKGACGEFLSPGRVRQGHVIALSLATGKTPSVDTRVLELGWEL